MPTRSFSAQPQCTAFRPPRASRVSCQCAPPRLDSLSRRPNPWEAWIMGVDSSGETNMARVCSLCGAGRQRGDGWVGGPNGRRSGGEPGSEEMLAGICERKTCGFGPGPPCAAQRSTGQSDGVGGWVCSAGVAGLVGERGAPVSRSVARSLNRAVSGAPRVRRCVARRLRCGPPPCPRSLREARVQPSRSRPVKRPGGRSTKAQRARRPWRRRARRGRGTERVIRCSIHDRRGSVRGTALTSHTLTSHDSGETRRETRRVRDGESRDH